MGCGAEHLPPSNANVANGSQLYLRPPCVPAQACHGVTFTFYAASIFKAETFNRNFPSRTFGFVTAISHTCHLKANGVCDRCGSGVRSTNDQLYYLDYVKRITN